MNTSFCLLKRTFLFLAAGCLAGHVFAADPTPPSDVTLSVMKGINFFRAQAATNEDGWLFHPIEGARVVGWKTNSIHLKLVDVTVPGFKYADPYEVLVPGNSPTDPMRKMTRYRTVLRDPSKDHQEKREAYDPNGPIVRETHQAIYEKDIGCRWRYGGLGNNALGILALRRCGIRADDPLISRPAYNLVNIINSFGLPDNTHDLAWMTAGFAVLPGDTFKRLTEQCANKLMDAQITTGPAAGLWGPVAINTSMASALLKSLGKLSEEKKALQTEMADDPHKKSNGKPTARALHIQEEIEKIDVRLIELQANSTRVTQLGLLMFDNFGFQGAGMDGWGRRTLTYQADRLNIETLPYLIQNQISADLDSTALVLFALRTAYENGRLPMQTWRPDVPKVAPTPGVPPAPPVSDFPPTRRAGDVIALTAKAMAAAKPVNGQWTELNIHQRVTDFSWLKAVPPLVTNATALAEPVTMASICRGAAVNANLQLFQSGKPGATALEAEAVHPILQDLATNKLVLADGEIRWPYDMLLQLTSMRNKLGKPARTDYAAWNELADWVLRQQNVEGHWGREKQWVLMPSTSLVALRKELNNITDADLMKMYDQPHLTPAFFAGGNIFRYGAPEASYFTAAALLYLADGLPDGWVPSAAPAATEEAATSAQATTP